VSTLTKEANKMSSDMLLAAVVAILGHAPVGDVLSVYTGASYAAQGIQNNVFSEHAEEDADHTGMIFMQKAGYNPVGMLTMLDRLEQVEKESPDIDMGFLQDHPLTPDRVAAAKAELATLGVPVTANSVRQADNSLPVTVIPAVSTSSKTVTLQVSGQPVAVLAASNRAEAESAASLLNDLLDNNLQMYEVKVDGPNVMAKGETLLTLTDADVAAQTSLAPVTPESLAAADAHALQVVLWQYDVTGISADQ
jgi:predicted Zn-dependent protease